MPDNQRAPEPEPDTSELTPLTFTIAQATQCRGIFGSTCTGCHGDDLEGISGPPLLGNVFGHWFDGPVSSLFNYLLIGIPDDNPGTLSPQDVAELIAFVAESNGFMPGDTPLPDNSEILALMGFHQ